MSQYLLAGTVLSSMFPKCCVAEKGSDQWRQFNQQYEYITTGIKVPFLYLYPHQKCLNGK